MFQALPPTLGAAMHPFLAVSLEATEAHEAAPVSPSPLFILPFVLLLGCIALLPLLTPHWWERHHPRISTGLGAITAGYYWLGLQRPGHIGHTMLDYFSFVSLIGSLFIVAGGIHLTVRGSARPSHNLGFLATGSLLANLIGTTGTSMLMIGPWMRMNRGRYTAFHTVFFIFIISNAAGCLTPIGDPPLFLGYLKGVPFFWTFEHLHIPWLLMVTALLTLFGVIDVRAYNRIQRRLGEAMAHEEKWSVQGLHNLLFLAAILAAVLHLPTPWREVVMLAAAAASYRTTSRAIHERNDFSFGPIKEVAWLFLGIFATMMPALDYLALHARNLGLASPATFYFATGTLSAVLDNAPTYLTFLSASAGTHLHPVTELPLRIDRVADIHLYIDLARADLAAISLGAVWFGAMTYIGNGPNLLVKSIVERAGLPAPHFLEYIYRYSLPILFPLLVGIGLIALRIA